MPSEHYLIVGVDYGTTFSGVTYVWSGKTSIKDVQDLRSWGGGTNDSQVPSRITYDPSAWGYGVESREPAYCWTKLLLDRHASPEQDFDDQILHEFGALRGFDDSRLLQLPPGKSAENVVADYLTQLYKSMMQQLEQRLSKEVLNITRIQFWFTLPAMWSVRADNATKDAAQRAGFASRPGDSLHLIREPEAAAIAALCSAAEDEPQLLPEVGSVALVCDCGGGTVDLASYKIKALRPKLCLEQACVSKGGKCGSTSIDRAFYKLMCDRFGSAFTNLEPWERSANSAFMQTFETAKRNLGTQASKPTHRLTLTIPGVEASRHYNPRFREVVLTEAELKELFDSTIEKIIKLLEQQVTETERESRLPVKAVLLVGGFGGSLYLFEKIGEWCDSRDIRLFSPPNAWQAICIGATLRGLEGPVVTQKKSRYHIGVAVNYEFRSGTDDEETSWIDSWDGLKKCSGMASWIVNRGEVVTPGLTKEREYWRVIPESKRWSTTLYQSEDSAVPEMIGHRSVTKLGELVVDLGDVDLSIFAAKDGEDSLGTATKKIYRIDYTYDIVLDDDMGHMYFRSIFRGKEIGKTRLEFSDDGEV